MDNVTDIILLFKRTFTLFYEEWIKLYHHQLPSVSFLAPHQNLKVLSWFSLIRIQYYLTMVLTCIYLMDNEGESLHVF